jgi:hypothetical protein
MDTAGIVAGGKNVPLEAPESSKPRKFPASGKKLGLGGTGAPRGTKFPHASEARGVDPPRRYI